MPSAAHAASSADWVVTGPQVMEMDKYLSNANAPDFEEDARLCIESGARDMVLDCAAMTYLTGAGARAFLTVAGYMQRVGGRVSVRGLSGQPRELFTACSIDAFVPVADVFKNLSCQAA